MKKHNCYNCIYKGDVVGSAHIKCTLLPDKKALFFVLKGGNITYKNNEGEVLPALKLNPHGVKMGWAMWPINFDPTWVDTCIFYKEKLK
jgi:hypothetical protein